MAFCYTPTTFLIICSIIFSTCTSSDNQGIPEDIRQLPDLHIIDPDDEPISEIELTRKQSFTDTDEVLIGRPGDLTADEYGNVYIAEQSPNHPEIYSFDPDGNYITTIGSHGSGPGEFQSISRIQYRDGYLYAYDGPLSRFSVFKNPYPNNQGDYSAATELAHIIQPDTDDPSLPNEISESFLFPINFAVTGDHQILTAFKPFDSSIPSLFYVFIDQEGSINTETILEIDSDEHVVDYSSGQMLLPTSRDALVAISTDGDIFTSNSEEFLIKVYDRHGEYQYALYKPYKRRELDKDKLASEYESSRRRAIQDAELPETWPALDEVLMDDENRLWIATLPDDPDMLEWWVLDENSELLTRFDWPKYKEIKEIKNSSVFVRIASHETGLTEVIQYDIEMEI